VYSVLRCPDLWLQYSATSSSKLCTKLTLQCNHRSVHLKTEYTESLYLLRRHLGNWPCSKQEKRTAGSTWETWTADAADGVRFTRVIWEIDFLLTFETAPFFCEYPVYFINNSVLGMSVIQNSAPISKVIIQISHCFNRTEDFQMSYYILNVHPICHVFPFRVLWPILRTFILQCRLPLAVKGFYSDMSNRIS
jgi:hypothetical protein